MRNTLLYLLLISFSVTAQKAEEVYFKDLQEVEYTNFVVTYAKTFSKVKSATKDKLVFIDTKLNTSKEVTLDANLNISNVATKFESKYQDAAFVLVESQVNLDRGNMKLNHAVRQLHLIKLTTFEAVKLTSTDFTLISWSFNETAGTLVILEKKNESSSQSAPSYKMVTIQLKTGVATEVYKIN